MTIRPSYVSPRVNLFELTLANLLQTARDRFSSIEATPSDLMLISRAGMGWKVKDVGDENDAIRQVATVEGEIFPSDELDDLFFDPLNVDRTEQGWEPGEWVLRGEGVVLVRGEAWPQYLSAGADLMRSLSSRPRRDHLEMSVSRQWSILNEVVTPFIHKYGLGDDQNRAATLGHDIFAQLWAELLCEVLLADMPGMPTTERWVLTDGGPERVNADDNKWQFTSPVSVDVLCSAVVESFMQPFLQNDDSGATVRSRPRKKDATDAKVKKRSWTQDDLDDAIRKYKAERAERYRELAEAVKQGSDVAKKAARKLFGRNAIARALGVKSNAMVGKSPAWIAIAQELGLGGSKKGSTSPAAPRNRKGFESSLEQVSLDRYDKDEDYAVAARLDAQAIENLLAELPEQYGLPLLRRYEAGELTTALVHKEIDKLAFTLIKKLDKESADFLREKLQSGEISSANAVSAAFGQLDRDE